MKFDGGNKPEIENHEQILFPSSLLMDLDIESKMNDAPAELSRHSPVEMNYEPKGDLQAMICASFPVGITQCWLLNNFGINNLDPWDGIPGICALIAHNSMRVSHQFIMIKDKYSGRDSVQNKDSCNFLSLQIQ